MSLIGLPAACSDLQTADSVECLESKTEVGAEIQTKVSMGFSWVFGVWGFADICGRLRVF